MRQDIPQTIAAVRHDFDTSAPAAGTYEPPQGTQHNPVAIDSSPEPESAVAQKFPTTASTQFERFTLGVDGFNGTEVVIQTCGQTRKKPKFYAVAGGHVPGIYTEWDDAEKQIIRFSGAKQKSFSNKGAAWEYLEQHIDLVRAANDRRISHSAMLARTPATSPTDEPAQWLLSSSDTTHLEPSRANLVIPQTLPSAFQSSLMSAMHDPPPPYTRYAQLVLPDTSRSVPQAPTLNDYAVDPEPILSPEQQKVVDLILAGHNVFYTGSAGCGKSTILKAFVKQLTNRGQRVRIVAPTNLAALNVNGQTTWTFAGWTPDSLKKSLDKLMQAAHGKEVFDRFDSTDVLVIDEISMVENLQFERLNHVMKASRGEKYGGGPFGGVQIIVTGDVGLPHC